VSVEPVISPFVFDATATYMTNANVEGSTQGMVGRKGSQREVMNYCNKLLQKRKANWDWVRKFLSLQYRGIILYGTLIRSIGQLAKVLECFQWARKFLHMANEEWNVERNNDYANAGSCFRPSFQIGIVKAEIELHTILRGGQWNTSGPYNVENELTILDELRSLITDRNDMKTVSPSSSLDDLIQDAAFRRLPLAFIHSYVAAFLMQECTNQPSSVTDPLSIKHRIKLLNDPRNLYAIIAEEYRTAATANLQDADDAAILWWGYAGNLPRAGWVRGDLRTKGFTLGELRDAIRNATRAKRLCDTALFAGMRAMRTVRVKANTHPLLDKSFETQARVVARHLQHEADDFVLPMLEMEWLGDRFRYTVGGTKLDADNLGTENSNLIGMHRPT